uniref:YprB ribonuclease H-like domain-containing protein n=1 Tax=Megaviridae environmental sample TaxID=1737588 RepID=A0A5J6VML8_9VIRU|nr:MAG: hypothetical protein [Megaviridae environmental sample]
MNLNYHTRFENDLSINIPKNIDWSEMVAATKVRNHLLDDPLLDWLEFHKIRNIKDTPVKFVTSNFNTRKIMKVKSESNFTNFIMKQGIEFEKFVINILRKKYQIIQIAESYQGKDCNKFLETVDHMIKGTEIIYQGVIHDYENKLFGCPDLMIRSDRFNEIFNMNLDKDVYSKSSRKLNTPFHYIIVDIKHSTLYLSSNGKNLLNCNSMPAYKGQIYIYNKILESIQGFSNNIGYVLGKKWNYTKNKKTFSGNNFMTKLGEINFVDYDSHYKDKVVESIDWVRTMRSEGQNWKLLPKPSVKELYPNMKNEKDGGWRKIKHELNTRLNDITSVWMCGIKRRKIGFSKNIKSWKDHNCTSKNLKFKKSKTSITLDKILNINRQNKDLIRVNNLTTFDDWRYFGDDKMEFFLDYETINSNMGYCSITNNDIKYHDNDIIFLIGVGYSINGKWDFKYFLCNDYSISAESSMISNFWKFINEMLDQNKKSEPIFVHWTKAEPSSYKKLLERHNNKFPNKDYYDLYELFKNNNIVVKGALNFSLKTIAKAMYNNNQISSSWDNSKCSNGLDAMLQAWELYNSFGTISGREPIMKDIIKYNEIDCKVLWEIMSYLRNNY